MGRRQSSRNRKRVAVRVPTQDISDSISVNREQELASVHRVLELDLLLEMIIDYAIRQNDGLKLCTQNLGNVRQVSKFWRTTVSNVLKRRYQPLFHLNLNQNYAKSLVNKFTQTVERKSNGRFFFFGLKATPPFFVRCEENYTLKPFMRQFAQRMVTLDLRLEMVDCWQLTNHFDQWLSMLQNLSVKIVATPGSLVPAQPLLCQRRAKLYKWLEFQLDGNVTLKTLVVSNEEDRIPIQLPPLPLLLNLRKLEFRGRFENNVLELLAKAPLPKLAELVVFLVPYLFPMKPDEILSQVLTNFRKTLKILHLDVADGHEFPPEDVVHLVNFPVMEKLEELRTSSISRQPGYPSVEFDLCFPKLKKLHLFHQTEDRFRRWTCGGAATKLEALSVELGTMTLYGFLSQIKDSDLQHIMQDFPNISSLKLTF